MKIVITLTRKILIVAITFVAGIINVTAQTTGSIQATLRNWDNSLASPSLTKFIRYPSGQETTGANPAPIIGLAPGDYWVEGYQKGPLGDYEYWGSKLATVKAGVTTSVTVTRYTPYVEDFWLELNGTRLSSTDYIAPGTVLTPKAIIRNRDAINWSVTVEIGWRYGSGSTIGTRSSSFNVNSGTTFTTIFPNITLSSSTTGDLNAYSRTRSSNPNISLIITDSWNWQKICSVNWGTIQATLRNWDNAFASPSLTKFIRNPSGQETTGANPAPIIGLAPGDYWVEGYQKGPLGDYEYWGSKLATVKAGVTTSVTVTRYTPYVEDFWLELNGRRLQPTDYVQPGVALGAKARIRNRDAASWSIFINLGWRYDSGSTVGTTQSSTVTVGGNSTVTITLPIILSSTTVGDLYSYVKTSSSNPNNNLNITDSWDWMKICGVNWGSIQATLRNWDNTLASPSLTRFVRQPSGQQTTGGNPAPIIGLAPGEYWVEGYQKGPLDDYEYWGSEYANVTAGNTTSITITRYTPYVEDFWFELGGIRLNATDIISPGYVLTPKAKIINRSSTSWSVLINIGWRYGSGAVAGTSQSFTVTVEANSTVTITLSDIDLSSTTLGDFYAYIKTSSSNPNNSLRITDSKDWTKMFSVFPNEATITGFSPPAVSSLIRETEISCRVKIKNTGSGTRVFWVGLSLAHEDATNSGWPILWYDIKPKSSSTLSPGQEEEITFKYIIPPNSKPGKYYTCASIWNGLNVDDWMMEYPRYDDTRNYSKWKDKETGKLTFYLGDYESDQPDVVEQIKKIVQLSVFENRSTEEMYFDGINSAKPLLYIRAAIDGTLFGVPVGAGGSILIDLADLFQITPEGKEGFVTIWVDGSAKIGLSVGAGPDVSFGIFKHNFDYNERAIADERKDVIITRGGKVGFWAIDLVSYDFNSQQLKGPRIHTEGTFGISVKMEGTIQGLVSREINRNDIYKSIIDAFVNENSILTCISLLSNSLFTICDLARPGSRKTTWDDGSWQLNDGIWESNLKLSKQYDGSNEKKLYAHHFYIDVPSGTRSLNVVTGGGNIGGSENVDLYLKHNGRPDLNGQPYEFSMNNGNNESINISNPSEGRWYIMLPSITPYDLVRVNASLDCTPSQPSVISGQTTVCQGSSQTYSISAVSGATSYTWTLPSGWSGSSTSTSILATVGASGGNLSVTANNSCGSSTARTLSMSVTAIPVQPGSITGQTTVCQGSSQTYSIIPISGATSYTWTLPSGWSGNSTSSTINTTIGGNSGTISVTADNSCGSSTQSIMAITVTALPSQPGAIAGSTTITRGSSQTYSISAVAGATSYIWTLPSGWSGSSTSTSITATVGVEALSGNISIAANNSCGSGDPNAINVIVSDCNPPAQSGAISGQAPVNQGDSYTYSIASVSGATSYTWTIPTGWTGTSTTTSITVIAGASGGIISVTANNSCGQSSSSTLNVTVSGCNPPAQPGVISGQTPVDQGASHTYSIASVSGAISYTWTIPTGWTGTSTSTSITATAGAIGGTISVTANNSCGQSSSSTLNVTVSGCNPPTQPGSISGMTTICQGSSQTYSITAVSGATSYTWTLPSGWSGISTSASITATAGANDGTISVTANNSCGSSTLRTLAVSVTARPPQPGTISGQISVNRGVPSTYSITPVSGATSYTWTIPTGWTGTSTTNSITATPGDNGGSISVTSSNSCGSSNPRSLDVKVEIICTVPQITLKWDDVLICLNVDSMILSYQWFNGTTPIIGANDQYYVTSKLPGVYKVEIIDKNGCRTMSNEIRIAGSKSLSIYPNPAKSSFTICINDQPVGKANLKIINATGMEIMNLKTEKVDIEFLREIPVDNLHEGFYIIQVVVNQVYLYSSKILVIK